MYKGTAPGATPIFLKIGLDASGSATTAAIVGAMHDAVDVYNADVITMSYGGWDTYHDGTSEDAQAVDYAVSQGAVVLISAGNSADDGKHYSGTVAGSSTTANIQVDVSGAGVGDTALWFNLVWYDGDSTSNVLSGQLYNASQNTISTYNDTQGESTRGTEARQFWYGTSGGPEEINPGSATYYIRVTNSSATSQDFHIYVYYAGGGSVTFNSPDTAYTIESPANADSAIAVGAYTTRKYWWNYANTGPYSWTSGETVDQISTFSSRGPRVDTGAPPKPNIVAPGSTIISARDDDVYTWPGGADAYFVDNDGPNRSNAAGGSNDGNGPAEYYVMQGTSMASPIAAGVAALILDKNSSWTPAQVRHALESTAADYGTAGVDSTYGWGLIDALAAIDASQPTAASWKDNDADEVPDEVWETFSDYATEHTVYIVNGGLLPSHTYRVAYYDGGGTKRDTQDATSDASGNLTTHHTFLNGTDVSGTWYAVVSEPDFTPPTTYDASWEYTLASDTFTATEAAIPEFPTILAAVATLGLCAGIYVWFRRRAMPSAA